MDERAALSGLTFLRAAGGTAKAPIHRYSFPPQECEFRGGEDLQISAARSSARSPTSRWRKDGSRSRSGRTAPTLIPAAVFGHTHIDAGVLAGALVRIGAYVADHGMEGDGPYRAARDLLLRTPPRIGGQPIEIAGETPLDGGVADRPALDGGIFPIQGPPGAGKTLYRRANDLLRSSPRGGRSASRRTATRSSAIFLCEVAKAAARDGRGPRLRAEAREGGSRMPAGAIRLEQRGAHRGDRRGKNRRRRDGVVLGALRRRGCGGRSVRRRGCADVACECSGCFAGGAERRAARRSAAARTADAGQPSRRHGRLRAASPAARRADDIARPRPLPRRDVAAAPLDLRLHLRAFL